MDMVISEDSCRTQMKTLPEQPNMNLTPFTRPGGRHISDTEQASAMRKMCPNPPSMNDFSWPTRISNDTDSLTSLDVNRSAASTLMTYITIRLLNLTFLPGKDVSFVGMDFVIFLVIALQIALQIALPSDAGKPASNLGIGKYTLIRSHAFVIVPSTYKTCNYAGPSQDKVPRTTWTTVLPNSETNKFLHVVSGILGRRETSIAHLSSSRLATALDIHRKHKVLASIIRSHSEKKPYVQDICKHQEIPKLTRGGADTMEYLNNVLDYTRRDAMPKDNTMNSWLTTYTMMHTPKAIRGCESGQGTKIRYTCGHLVAFATVFGLPLAAAAFTILPAHRIIAGIGASGAAVAVIPLRTIPEITKEVWISAYAVWSIFFSAYLVMQILLIPSEMSSRRKWFVSWVIIAAVHFSIGLAQTSTTLADAFTIFGPLVATVCTYVMSLMFNTGESNSQNADVRSQGIELVQMALSV